MITSGLLPSHQSLNEIESSIETIIKFIENNLCLNDALLKEYFPILVKQCAYQLMQILDEIGDTSLTYSITAPPTKHIHNFFIQTILCQMHYLKKSNSIALLIWMVVLFRISKLIYKNLAGEIADYLLLNWKKIVLELGVPNWKEIDMYQSCLASHLIDSTREFI